MPAPAPWAPPTVRVGADPGFEDDARTLATRLGLPCGPVPARYELRVGAGGVALVSAHAPSDRAGALRVDLSTRRSGQVPVVRAVTGGRPRDRVGRVVDATAGLGADAAALTRAGLEVVMIERHPVIGALLADALTRLEAAEPGAVALSLRVGDARELLATLAPPPQVVFLDPMHPRRRGGAKRASAAWLRDLSGPPDEVEQRALLARARAVARRRVVVKRPAKSAPLGPGRSGRIEGRTVRFDLYAPDR